jgi:hypothetical protein
MFVSPPSFSFRQQFPRLVIRSQPCVAPPPPPPPPPSPQSTLGKSRGWTLALPGPTTEPYHITIHASGTKEPTTTKEQDDGLLRAQRNKEITQAGRRRQRMKRHKNGHSCLRPKPRSPAELRPWSPRQLQRGSIGAVCSGGRHSAGTNKFTTHRYTYIVYLQQYLTMEINLQQR